MRGKYLPPFTDSSLTSIFQNVWRIPKIQNHTSSKPFRSRVVLRSAYPTLRLLPASRLTLTTTPTMVGLGARFTVALWRLKITVLLGELKIDLKDGKWRNKPQTAHFRFICDQHAEEVCKRPCFCLIGGDISLSLPFLRLSISLPETTTLSGQLHTPAQRNFQVSAHSNRMKMPSPQATIPSRKVMEARTS